MVRACGNTGTCFKPGFKSWHTVPAWQSEQPVLEGVFAYLPTARSQAAQQETIIANGEVVLGAKQGANFRDNMIIDGVLPIHGLIGHVVPPELALPEGMIAQERHDGGVIGLDKTYFVGVRLDVLRIPCGMPFGIGA